MTHTQSLKALGYAKVCAEGLTEVYDSISIEPLTEAIAILIEPFVDCDGYLFRKSHLQIIVAEIIKHSHELGVMRYKTGGKTTDGN